VESATRDPEFGVLQGGAPRGVPRGVSPSWVPRAGSSEVVPRGGSPEGRGCSLGGVLRGGSPRGTHYRGHCVVNQSGPQGGAPKFGPPSGAPCGYPNWGHKRVSQRGSYVWCTPRVVRPSVVPRGGSREGGPRKGVHRGGKPAVVPPKWPPVFVSPRLLRRVGSLEVYSTILVLRGGSSELGPSSWYPDAVPPSWATQLVPPGRFPLGGKPVGPPGVT
jgi:hypothetical protein